MTEQLAFAGFENRPPGWGGLHWKSQAAYATLAAEIKARRCRGRLEGARLWGAKRWMFETGVHPLSLPPLEAAGFVRWEGPDLVLPHHDLRTEMREARISKIQAARAVRGNQMRAMAYRRAHRLDAFPQPDPDPDPVDTVISRELFTSPPAMAAPSAAPRSEDLLLSDPPPGEIQISSSKIDLVEETVQPRKDQQRVEVGRTVTLTPGALKAWRAYPEKKRDNWRLRTWQLTWNAMGLEPHADWVVEQINRFISSREWVAGFVPEPENFLRRKIKELRRPRVETCPNQCCRPRNMYAAPPGKKSPEFFPTSAPLAVVPAQPPMRDYVRELAAAAAPPDGGWRAWRAGRGAP